MISPILSKGQNIPLPPNDLHQIDVVLGWTESEVEIDASALLLNAEGKVRSDADFVFYNQPESEDGSVRFLGTGSTEEGAQARLTIDLSAVPEDVHSVAVGKRALGHLRRTRQTHASRRRRCRTFAGGIRNRRCDNRIRVRFRRGLPAKRRVEGQSNRAGLGLGPRRSRTGLWIEIDNETEHAEPVDPVEEPAPVASRQRKPPRRTRRPRPTILQ